MLPLWYPMLPKITHLFTQHTRTRKMSFLLHNKNYRQTVFTQKARNFGPNLKTMFFFNFKCTNNSLKYLINTISLHFLELLPKNNAKLWKQIEFTTKHWCSGKKNTQVLLNFAQVLLTFCMSEHTPIYPFTNNIVI